MTLAQVSAVSGTIYIDLLDLICFSAIGIQTVRICNTKQNICVGSFFCEVNIF